jgi:hypothetical protein
MIGSLKATILGHRELIVFLSRDISNAGSEFREKSILFGGRSEAISIVFSFDIAKILPAPLANRLLRSTRRRLDGDVFPKWMPLLVTALFVTEDSDMFAILGKLVTNSVSVCLMDAFIEAISKYSMKSVTRALDQNSMASVHGFIFRMNVFEDLVNPFALRKCRLQLDFRVIINSKGRRTTHLIARYLHPEMS